MSDRRRALLGKRMAKNGLVVGTTSDGRIIVLSSNTIKIVSDKRFQDMYAPLIAPVAVQPGDVLELKFEKISGSETSGRWIIGFVEATSNSGTNTDKISGNLSGIAMNKAASTSYTGARIRIIRDSTSGAPTDLILNVSLKVNGRAIV